MTRVHPKEAIMFNRILVPTDFSDSSDAALEYARALAQKFDASLFLLHVIEPTFTAGAFTNEMYVPETPGMYAVLLKEALSKFAHRVRPSDRARYAATTEVITGPCAGTIVQYAADRDIDLIVMGTHGRTGLAHLLMGSVAEHVVRAAPCPVLTTRGTGKERIPIEELGHERVAVGV